jgi:hypothetical protein
MCHHRGGCPSCRLPTQVSFPHWGTRRKWLSAFSCAFLESLQLVPRYSPRSDRRRGHHRRPSLSDHRPGRRHWPHRPPWGVRCPSSLGSRRRRPVPVPLFPAPGAKPETGLLPPLSYMLGPDITSKIEYIPFCLGETLIDGIPPGDGTHAPKIQNRFLVGG